MIKIDGSYGEGGGALVRVATALSALTKKTIRIDNIRANRPRKGLSHQHLNAIEAVSKLCNAEVDGLKLGSTTIIFSPKELEGGSLNVNIGTAGSIGLVLQALMIPAAFSESKTKITITGGTDVKWAPPIDYISNVTLPILKKMGYKGKISLLRRGYYPKGGGKVIAEIKPIKKLKPLKLIESEIESIEGISYASNLPKHVADRQAKSAYNILKKTGLDVDIDVRHDNESLSPGSGIVLWAKGNTRIGSSSLGERGKRAEIVGKEAAKELLNFLNSGAPLDKYMGDQIIPYISLTENSKVRTAEFTLHAHTNVYVVKKILGKELKIENGLGKITTIST